MIDPLTQKYLEVLNEGSHDKGIVNTNLKTGADAFGDFKKGDDPDENVDLEKPTEDKENSKDKKDGKMEKCKSHTNMKENTQLNPFETLYNKIISEDSFGWSMDKDEDEDEGNAGEVDDFELSDESETDDMSDEDEADDMDDEGDSGEVTFTLDKETAQKLIDVLQAAIGGEDMGEDEIEDEDEFDMGDEDEDEDIFSSEDEDETLAKEEVDAEIVGHSLVDQEKLLKGMNNPKNGVVKGALSAKKKKANVPLTGKGFKGELNKHKESAGKKLQGKNNKVSAVNAKNKTLIDNK
jgi:hypothetical protein